MRLPKNIEHNPIHFNRITFSPEKEGLDRNLFTALSKTDYHAHAHAYGKNLFNLLR